MGINNNSGTWSLGFLEVQASFKTYVPIKSSKNNTSLWESQVIQILPPNTDFSRVFKIINKIRIKLIDDFYRKSSIAFCSFIPEQIS